MTAAPAAMNGLPARCGGASTSRSVSNRAIGDDVLSLVRRGSSQEARDSLTGIYGPIDWPMPRRAAMQAAAARRLAPAGPRRVSLGARSQAATGAAAGVPSTGTKWPRLEAMMTAVAATASERERGVLRTRGGRLSAADARGDHQGCDRSSVWQRLSTQKAPASAKAAPVRAQPGSPPAGRASRSAMAKAAHKPKNTGTHCATMSPCQVAARSHQARMAARADPDEPGAVTSSRGIEAAAEEDSAATGKARQG